MSIAMIPASNSIAAHLSGGRDLNSNLFHFDFPQQKAHSPVVKATEVTIQLPSEDAEFLEAYAKEHATSVAEIFTRYARRLQSTTRREPHSENVKFTGSVPTNLDARDAYRKHMVEKHR